MTQSYRPNYSQEGFRPLSAPDMTRGLAEQDARIRQAQQATLSQMQRDSSTIQANTKAQSDGVIKLAEF